MKINVHFTIDEEIVKKLRQIENRSQLVETLLKGHLVNFRQGETPDMVKAKELKDLSKKAKSLRKQMKIIKQVIKLVGDMKSVQFIKGQVETWGSLNQEETERYIRSRRLGIAFEDMIKAMEIINNNVAVFI